MSSQSSRRTSPNRRKTNVKARANLGDSNVPITILEISHRGMRIAAPSDFLPGTGITIEIMDEEIPAIVHWSLAPLAGLHLLEQPECKILKMLESAEDDLAEFR